MRRGQIDDLLVTIFLASMSVLIAAGVFLYQDHQLPTLPHHADLTAQLVTIEAKP